MMILYLNLTCWIIFSVVWVFGAVYNYLKAPTARQSRLRYDWLVCAVIANLIVHPFYRELTALTFHVVWLNVIGAALLVVSTFFTHWSRLELGKMWSNTAQIRDKHKLVTNGPYQITRNPIYTGILGMLLGSTLSIGGSWVWVIFLCVLVLFIFRIRNEEKLLFATFGGQYVQYKKRVPQLIPRLKFSTKKN